MKVLVDTDILIEVSRARNLEIVDQWQALSLRRATVYYSPVTVAELWAGMRPSEREYLMKLLGALVSIPATDNIGQRAGDYLRRYRKSHSVELPDALIAASAVEVSAPLWTRNRKHYPMPELGFYLADSIRRPEAP
jgi:predicted nucleic acid-binding protein